MSKPISRRQVLKSAGLAVTGALVGAPSARAQNAPLRVAGQPVEIVVSPVSAHTVRLSMVPIVDGRAQPIPYDGSLVQQTWGPPRARLTTLTKSRSVRCGSLIVKLSPEPLTLRLETSEGRLVQQLQIDAQTGALTFVLGEGPVLGLGEGGAQFDRRGAFDSMRSGQGGYQLRTHGTRVPVPWLIGTGGWAMYLHQPYGAFDLTGKEGRFVPGSGPPLPLDLFVVAAPTPTQVMAEYARLTGLPEMPPRWALGYQQSHRTLADRTEVLSIAQTFREKRLPCDALIYLGTGFCPSGWNTGHGSFRFHPTVFPDPERMLQELHAQHFHVVPHVVILSRTLRGTVRDRCDPAHPDEADAACYWDRHRAVFALGVGGWWPDEGDPLDAASRLTRNRMYWEGPQQDRPNERPYALHRNGYAGMQRYASFLWSGDVHSTWETLRTHIPIAINTGLSGIPYWGTDTGGFIPTRELTGELYVRWFQFSAFCPLFRSHGRTWKLRLPWGWNTGELGPNEITPSGEVANPDPGELHNAAVEPICRKYLELRYRLMPYLYTLIRESHTTGLPILRALWLHYPDDATAVARGDVYLWGRDILVAPVTERGAGSRRLYLPAGLWYGFWTEEKVEGGREIARQVDLATLPLYVRAGAILPLGPTRQYTDEQVEGPLTLCIYPGAEGAFTLYEDDGLTFDHRRGEWLGIEIRWDDQRRRLRLRLAKGSRMLPPQQRNIEVRIVPEKAVHRLVFSGHPITVTF